MTTEITTAARRIAREHNARRRAGFSGNGFLIFGRDGSGGAWYSDNSRPALDDSVIKISVGWEKMTTAEAQVALDYSADLCPV
jgi:hypothetical protein